MIKILEVRACPYKFHPHRKEWVKLQSSILVWDNPDLYNITMCYVNNAKKNVMRDKIQRRLILSVDYENRFGYPRRKYYLVARVVYNPDKPYVQCDGEYNGFELLHDKPIKVIGREIEHHEFSIENSPRGALV